MSKGGYTSLRNIQLLKLDRFLREMDHRVYKQIQTTKRVQESYFENWLGFSIIVIFLFLPILLAISEDWEPLDLKVVLAPVSFLWVTLGLVCLLMYKHAKFSYKEMQSLKTMEFFKHFPKVKGRNT